MTLPVTFAEATLGAKVEVPLIDGSTVTVKVPAGSDSGRTLRLKGRGVATKKGTGDLLATSVWWSPRISPLSSWIRSSR